VKLRAAMYHAGSRDPHGADSGTMTSEKDNTQFIEAARSHGMLSQERAAEVLKNAGETDVAATVVLQRGLMDAHQVDMIQTLVAGAESIPGYTLLDIIGYGGMGVVFRARQETLDREVALKTILVGGRIDEAIQRFRKEATSIARLNHPNIVTAFDSGQQDGRIYLSMEFVKGQNLSQYVQEHGTLSEAEALSFTRQAAMGLAHAWEHGIVHRDIKPDNLLITHPSGIDQARTVKITDLGLAHLNTDSEATRLTQPGAAVGSPLYMAPEQLSGDAVDCRSDIYSLGSTLYFMLSNRAPFDGDSVASVLYNKAAGKSVPLTEVASVNDETRQLVATMMAVTPDDRIQNYQTLVDTIDDALQHSHTKQTSLTTRTDAVLARKQSLPVNSALQDTTLTASAPTPEPTCLQSAARMPLWIPVVGVLAIVVGTFLAWPSRHEMTTREPPRQEMRRTWEEPLFSGSSLTGWRSSPGIELSIETDPVESATVLSLNSGTTPSGWATRQLPVPNSGNPWFEIGSHVLPGSSQAGGITFGITNAGPEYRLRITNDAAILLNDSTGETIATQASLPPITENSVSVMLRFQPGGWQISVSGSLIATVPVREGTQPAFRLFTEGGQTYFSDLNAAGLEVIAPPPNTGLPAEAPAD
jgi:serine/threonine protein kinase